MGAVVVSMEILGAGKKGKHIETVEAMVDTGATLSIIPAHLLHKLGIKPIERIKTRLADGRVVVREVGEACLRINGKTVTSRVIFGAPKDVTVVGLVVLESLGLTVDPITRRLIPGEYFML